MNTKQSVLLVLTVVTASWTCAISAGEEKKKEAKEPWLVTELFHDETSRETRPLWLAFKKCLPTNHFFGVQGAWIDKERKTALCIFFKYRGRTLTMYDNTNAHAAIIDKTDEGYACRQLIKLWDSRTDTVKKERLSLPMHYHFLDKDCRSWPDYSRARIYVPDIDDDGDKDLAIVLHQRHGADTIILRNNDGKYVVALSKRGSQSELNFGHDVLPLNRFDDLDDDGIPELFNWDQLIDPGCNAEYRCWIDIYHWDGKGMVQCNSQFPETYASVKKELIKICEKYKSSFKQYYYLGMISEYEGKTDDAVDYYNKCLESTNCIKEYAEAAKKRLKEIGKK